MNIKEVKDVIDGLIYEVVIGKNPFKVGDLVKLRPDILKLVHQGPNHESRTWRETLENLEGKMGKVDRIFPNSKTVSVEFEEPWTNKDQWGRDYTVGSIGIDYDKLVPYAKDPSLDEQFGGYVSDKDMKKDPKHISGERWRIKFQSSSDLEKHGNTEKSPITNELRDLGKIPDQNVSINEIREVVQELLKEMWIGWEEEEEGKVGEVKKKIKETQDNPNKSYIILGKSGPVTTYYVSNDTQGERMVQWGQSIATKFHKMEDVRHKIIQLKQRYKGIKNWDYEVVSSKPDWEGIWKPTGKTIMLGNKVLKPVKKGDEWVVKWYVNGKRDENRDYYTDDKKDAYDTYAKMLKHAEEENNNLNPIEHSWDPQ